MFTKNAVISTDVRLANMLLELSDIHWDVVCFCETRAASADYILDGGHRLIAHRGAAYGGVAALWHARLAGAIAYQREFGDRVVGVQLQLSCYKFTIISVYMPHAGYASSHLEKHTQTCQRR